MHNNKTKKKNIKSILTMSLSLSLSSLLCFVSVPMRCRKEFNEKFVNCLHNLFTLKVKGERGGRMNGKKFNNNDFLPFRSY